MKEAGDLMSEQSQHIHFENTNRWSTKQLVTMALMCALGALFMYVQLPILPSAPFLTYDPSLVPAMVCGFAYGPVPAQLLPLWRSLSMRLPRAIGSVRL